MSDPTTDTPPAGDAGATPDTTAPAGDAGAPPAPEPKPETAGQRKAREAAERKAAEAAKKAADDAAALAAKQADDPLIGTPVAPGAETVTVGAVEYDAADGVITGVRGA